MMFGVHISIAGGIDKAVNRAVDRGCDAFQIFTRSSRQWAAKDISDEVAQNFITLSQTHNFQHIVVHMPYLPNLATIETVTYNKSVNTLVQETKRCDLLKIPYLVLHLGSHKGVGSEKGLKQVIKALNTTLEIEPKVKLLLENSAGTKNAIGSTFEELGLILSSVTDPKKIGICFDTCHGFAAGYDLRTQSAVEKTLSLFDTQVGIRNLNVIHANDSKGKLNSRKDRHEHIGLGYIREKGFISILSLFPKVPYILETPIDEIRDDIENLEKIRSLVKG